MSRPDVAKDVSFRFLKAGTVSKDWRAQGRRMFGPFWARPSASNNQASSADKQLKINADSGLSSAGRGSF